MYYASVGDAAFLDDAGDLPTPGEIVEFGVKTAESYGTDLINKVMSQASTCDLAALRDPYFLELVAKGWPGTQEILNRCAPPAASRATSVAGRRLTAVRTSIPAAKTQPRTPFTTAPLPSVSSEPTPLGAAPFRAPSRMVGPSLTVVPAFQPQATPTVMASAQQAAPSQGMSGTTMLLVGAAVLGGLYLFSRK